MMEMLIAAEELRAAVAKHIGAGWWSMLPRVPLTSKGAKLLAIKQMERDEIAVVYQLRQLSSLAAWIIIQLRSTAAAKQKAFDRAQHDGVAQISLASIVGGARVSAHYQGRT